MKQTRDYSFAIIAVVRDDEFSKPIEMPIFRSAYNNLPMRAVHDMFRAFIDHIQEPDTLAEANVMLKNLASSINKEHAMAYEFTRLERKEKK